MKEEICVQRISSEMVEFCDVKELLWAWLSDSGIPAKLSSFRCSVEYPMRLRPSFVYFHDLKAIARLTRSEFEFQQLQLALVLLFALSYELTISRISTIIYTCTKWLQRDRRSARPVIQPAQLMYNAFQLLHNSSRRGRVVQKELHPLEVRSRNQQWVSRCVKSRH